MASVVNGNQVRLNSGQVLQAQQGGWYDGQQFWGGTLSQPGQINVQSNQQGAGQAVSQEVIAQTNPANVSYINEQRQNQGLTPSPTVQQQQQQTQQQVTTPSTGQGAGVGAITPPETINLPQLYEGLYAKSGVRDLESKLTEQQTAYNEQVAKIKNNPYLSEATMTGRIKKLDEKFSADQATIQNQVAMKKADIETQLNLQTKQFDINSQVAKQALDQFQVLLSSGALDNANGQDIASLTYSTGLSSSMIQSAIDVSRKSKEKPVDTQVISFDDGTNQGYVLVNSQTGEVINKQIVAASKPTKGGSGEYKPGSAANLAESTASMAQQIQKRLNSYGDISPADWNVALNAWLGAGLPREDFIKNFGGYADTNRGDFQSAYGFANPTY